MIAIRKCVICGSPFETQVGSLRTKCDDCLLVEKMQSATMSEEELAWVFEEEREENSEEKTKKTDPREKNGTATIKRETPVPHRNDFLLEMIKK